MHIKSAVTSLTGAALISSVVASPASTGRVLKSSKRQVQEITSELGCDAKGPLSGPWAVELFTCQIDSNYTCQATGTSGCDAGDATNIESLMVLDSTTGQPLSGASSIAEAFFKCPEHGLVQCAVRFANNGSEAGSYGLRITNSTEGTPFSDAAFGAPTDSASNSTDMSSTPTDSATDSFGSPTDSGADSFGSPTDSGTDSFGSPTDSSADSGFGSSPTDSMGDSSSDTGFGSPTDSTSDTLPADSTPTDTSFDSASTDTSDGDSSSDTFDSDVYGDGSTSPSASDSTSSATSTSGFGSIPTSELGGFS